MQTNGRPVWFALKLERREVLELLPPEKLAHVLKMCFDFLETRQRLDVGDALERLAFAAIAPDIEAAWIKYDASVRNGRKGGRPSKTQGFPENRGVSEKPEGTHIDIEKETDVDKDIDTHKEKEDMDKEDAASPPPAPARSSGMKSKGPVRHRYGAYQNVLLGDEERAALERDFPLDLSERIERLSEYLASSGRTYKSHAATLRVWARRDAEKKGVERFGTTNTDPRPDLPGRIPSVLDDCFDDA